MAGAGAERLPFRGAVARQAGESLQGQVERVRRLIEDPRQMAWVLLALAVAGWVHHFHPTIMFPILYSAAAVVGFLWSHHQTPKLKRQLQRLEQGRRGEEYVAQWLDRLKQHGYHVFHDIPADGFNIDHALVGPAGVFVIETKTFSKVASRSGAVTIRQEVLIVGGHPVRRDPLQQAHHEARWLQRQIAAEGRLHLKVHPILAVPGWFVEEGVAVRDDIWVLNEKRIQHHVLNAPRRLSRHEVAMTELLLSQWSRRTPPLDQRL